MLTLNTEREDATIVEGGGYPQGKFTSVLYAAEKRSSENSVCSMVGMWDRFFSFAIFSTLPPHQSTIATDANAECMSFGNNCTKEFCVINIKRDGKSR